MTSQQSTPVRSKHNSCVVVWRIGETGQVEFLTIDVNTTYEGGQTSGWQTKFPGGGNRIETEKKETTAQRELLEETGLVVLIHDLVQIWEHSPNDTHTRYGFLVPYDKCQGELRTVRQVDNGDDTQPPRFMSVDELKHVLFRTHQPAFLEAGRRLRLF